MVKFLCFQIFILSLFCISFGDELNQANLLVHKKILNRFLVEGRDLIVEYVIYNVGGSAALDIHLTDSSFPEEDFEVITGMLKMRLDRLGAGSNISHSLVLKPRKYGYYNFTSAEVTYLTSEEASDVQIGYTTQPGEGLIIPMKDFDRQFSPPYYGLGCLCCNDPTFSWDPIPPLVQKQVKI
ncbi:NOL6 [Cordylochernes scorpioides]|uniref:NOL6 n=1 Tax=Cordylochernes scorpioides TaxID=51811 RepID=A0ABY6L5L5_9ARAC|nr:NOL6 [Cordylochernes scorpioides]